MTASPPLPEEIQQFLDSLSNADLQKLATCFAAGQSGMVQLNAGNSKAFQVHIAGGTVYIGDHDSIAAAALKQVLKELIDPKPTIGIPQNLPYSGVAQFVGRQAELERLHQQLQPESPLVISAVSGMGGIGKTELALEYARQQCRADAYPGGICWLRAREDVGSQIISFARSLLNLTPPDDLELEEKVRWCWERWREGAVLLILDDVQDYAEVRSVLPPTESRFKVLMTTRSHFGAPVQEVQLDVLSEAEALELLRVLVQDDRIDQQLEQAKQLCDWLGYLPLGVELVGRYLAEDKDLSLQKLWQELQDERIEAEALKREEDMPTASLGVLAAFELSWQKLTADAQQLAAVLSLFALAEIPWHLVVQCLPAVNEAALKKLRNKQLLKLSLLKRVDESMYQLHQLLREFFASKRSQRADDAELQRQFYQVVVAEAERVRDKPERSLIKESTIMIAHLQAAIDLLARSGQALDLATCLHWIANLYHEQGRYQEAEPLFVRSLEMRQQYLGDHHLDVAESLNDLATLYQLQGRYSEAEPLLVRSLSIREQHLSADHPDVAASLNNLALLYREQARYAEAESLYERSLSIWEHTDHPHMAIGLNNLAGFYNAQGRYTESEPLLVRSLSILEQQLGEDHPDVAINLNNLAELYRVQGRYSEAEPLHRRSLSIRERHLGQDHPNVSISLGNLAALYNSQGRYTEAEPLLVRSLSIQEQQLGTAHPDVAFSLNNLAYLYNSQGRYSKVEPLYRRSLSIREKQLGAQHPDVAFSLNNLAEFYRSQGRYTEAEPLFQRSLSIREQQLGDNHPDVAISLNNLAALYDNQGRYAEAEPLYVRSLSIREQQLGDNHPDVAISLNNLARLYRSQARYTEAEPLFQRSLSILQNQLPVDHPLTAGIVSNLAHFYDLQGRYSEAESLYLQALPILSAKLEENHEWRRDATNNWRSFLQKVIQEQRTDELSNNLMTQQWIEQLKTQN